MFEIVAEVDFYFLSSVVQAVRIFPEIRKKQNFSQEKIKLH